MVDILTEENATDSRSNRGASRLRSLSFALLGVGQGLEIRYPDRCTISESDYCLQRIGIKSPQRFVSDIAKVRGDGDVIHGAEGMIGGRRLDIEDVDPGAGDAPGSRAPRSDQPPRRSVRAKY